MKSNLFVIVSVALILSACSAPPSESDILAAMTQEAKILNKMGEDMYKKEGLDPKTATHHEWTAIKIFRCKGDGEKVFVCDVEAGHKIDGVEFKQTRVLRLIKESNEWAVIG